MNKRQQIIWKNERIAINLSKRTRCMPILPNPTPHTFAPEGIYPIKLGVWVRWVFGGGGGGGGGGGHIQNQVATKFFDAFVPQICQNTHFAFFRNWGAFL